MSCDYDFVENDTNSVLRITAKDAAGVIIDLTGGSVDLKFKDAAGALKTKTMSISTPETNGVATYQFSAGELLPPIMYCSVKITDTSGKFVHSNCILKLKIRPLLT